VQRIRPVTAGVGLWDSPKKGNRRKREEFAVRDTKLMQRTGGAVVQFAGGPFR
jgi:hypothetical protein